ncbi:MAG: transporter, partial [Solimicrobium sp.]|nr:transporter [Solimicrobium sp.]
MTQSAVKRYLPWVVAAAVFMEQLDSTIVNTAVPTMAADLNVLPLSLKAVVTSSLLSLALFIPVSGWIADRFGTRRVFKYAVLIFTLSSLICGISLNVPMLIAARVLQGMGAALMIPVGRLAIIRTFPKSELLAAMNFVIIPALIGPLLGPLIGGLIVQWLSWRVIFFVNIPVGLIALNLSHRFMPDYFCEEQRPLDFLGLSLFASGTALMSWVLEIFGEHGLSTKWLSLWFIVSLTLLAAYMRHAHKHAYPLLDLTLFRIRTFRVSVAGGFITRLGIGACPLLIPLLYQLGLGLPAWQAGLLMTPLALVAISMKMMAPKILACLGYRKILVFNTGMIGITIMSFTCMNSMAFADIQKADSSMASTITSSLQQLSMSFGLACG